MPAIEVDFDVFKALTLRRPSEEVSENDVLRQLLGLPAKKDTAPGAALQPGDWVTKGVRFPVGTEFRATYKGQTHLARVEGGALVMNGKRYDTPSAAAMAITESPVNGWMFWQARLPGHAGWRPIKSLRKSARSTHLSSCTFGGSALSCFASTRFCNGSEGIFRSNNEDLGSREDTGRERISAGEPPAQVGHAVDRGVDLAAEALLCLKTDVKLIEERLKAARRDYEARYGKEAD